MNKSLTMLLSELTARVAGITARGPDALRELANRIDECDGMPTSVIGAAPPTSAGVEHVPACSRCDHALRAHDLRRGCDCGCQTFTMAAGDPGQSTRTEAAALRLGPLVTQSEVLESAIRKLCSVATVVEMEINRLVRPEVDKIMCNRGVGREDVVVWGDPLCESVAAEDRGGLCIACAKREQRHRKDHGLPSRDRDAA